MTRPSKIVAIIYGVLSVLVSMSVLCWPDDLTLPLPIAAVFGPLLALRLGLGVGVMALVMSLSMAAPFLFEQNIATISLLMLGTGVWLVTGYFTGTLLYA